MNFEQALARLESITESLQTPQSLQQALDAYTEGCELVKFCQMTLNQAEQKLHILDEQQQLKELDLDQP